MATEVIKSAQITNAEATPATLNPAYQDGGRVRVKRGRALAVLAAADVGSIYRFFRVKSSDMMKSLLLDNSAAGATGAIDIGLYRTVPDGGAVVDADFFGSAVAITAAQRGLDVLRESGVITYANMEKRIWEALGLSADPNLEYDVCATITIITAAAVDYVLTGEVVGGH